MAITRGNHTAAAQTIGTNTMAIAKPTGISTGDILVLLVSFHLFAPQTPTDFTKLAVVSENIGGAYYGMSAFYKVVDGTEPSSWTIKFDSTWGGGIGHMIAYEGGHASQTIDAYAVATGGSGYGTTLARPVTLQSADMLVMAAFAWRHDIGLTGFSTLGGSYSDFINHVNSGPLYGKAGTGRSVMASANRIVNQVGQVSGGSGVTNAPGFARVSIGVALRVANRAPDSPTPTAPGEGEYVDLAGVNTFSWANHDDDIGDVQSAFALKRNTGGSDSWYNATAGTWGASEVWNTTPKPAVIFPTGKWLNDGTTYNWAVAIKDQDGLVSPYSPYQEVTGATPPAIEVLAPRDTYAADLSPIVFISYEDDTFTMRSLQVKVFTSVAVAEDTFTPATTQPLWDSGEILTNSKQIQIPSGYLENVADYSVYVRVSNNDVDAPVYTGWKSATFSTLLGAPATPELITANAEFTPSPRIRLVVQGHDNHLTYNQSSLGHGHTRGWIAFANCTIDVTDDWSAEGDWSLVLLPSGTGTASAMALATSTTSAKEGRDVVAGEVYTALATVRAAVGTTPKSCRVNIRWYDEDGTLLSTTVGSNFTSSTSSDVQLTVSGTAPTTAVFAVPVLVVDSSPTNTDLHYFDKMYFGPGSVTAWSRGGYLYGNRLNLNTSSGEPNAEGLEDNGNALITRTISNKKYDDGAFLVRARVAGDILVAPGANGAPFKGKDAFEVTPGQFYTYMASFRWTGTGRLCALLVGFWDENEQPVNTIYGSNIITDSGTFQTCIAQGAIPDTAKYTNFSCWILGCAALEQHYIDGLSIHLGRSELWGWGPGQQTEMVVERSTDAGVSWENVRTSGRLIPDAAQRATVFDYEVPNNPAIAARYRARVESDV